MTSFRHIRKLFIAPFAIVAVCVTAATADIADGEREFVQQFLNRAMFDLAEQFCRERAEGPADVNERAEWEFVLSECQQQHAWFMNEDSRNGSISQSAERLTNFLRDNTPAAEKDILLRVRQIEVLVAAGLMEEIVHAPVTYSAATANSTNSAIVRKGPSNLRFALEAIAQAKVLAEATQKQIEAVRRNVDADIIRVARERLRMALAEICFIQSRLLPPSEAIGLTDQADVMTEQLQKSVANDELRFRCRMMLAELQLDRNDFAAFRLRYGTASTAAETREEKAQVAALKIRSLLKQGQPSEALQEYVDASKNGLTLTQELQTLRLQGLLQLMELLHQLEESPQRAELQKTTANEFSDLTKKTLQLTSGVWRERCIRIINRFERVQEVGPEAASELEQVAVLIEAGEVSAGRLLLQKSVQRYATKNPGLAASMLLQSGNLSIRTSDWKVASQDLSQARQLFQQAGDIPAAAASDLLRIYVVGQLWNSTSEAGVSEQDYSAAIEQHLETFSDQKTTATVRAWRARLLRDTDPLKAADEFLDLAEISATSTENADAHRSSEMKTAELDLLCFAGSQLLHAIAQNSKGVTAAPPDSETRLEELCEQFNSRCRTLFSNDSTDNLPQMQVLRSQQAGLSLRKPLPAATDWKAIGNDARRTLEALKSELEKTIPLQADSRRIANSPSNATTSRSQSSAVSQLETSSNGSRSEVGSEIAQLIIESEIICNSIVLLAGMRQLEDSSNYEESRISLVKQSRADHLKVGQLLMRQLPATGAKAAGDAQLANFLISLVSDDQSKGLPVMTIDHRIEVLPILQFLSVCASSTTAYDSNLNELLAGDLTETQLTAVANIVTQMPSTSSSASRIPAARKFWLSVQKRTKPGQEIWLEASLQLAMLAEKEGNLKEAKRIIGVVDVLHPEWGAPSRKTRANEFRQRLETSGR